MIYTVVLWLLLFMALCTSIGALVAAHRSSALSHWKRVEELSERFSKLEASHEELTHQLRNLRSRLNMQAGKDRRSELSQAQNGGSLIDPMIPPGPGASEEHKAAWKRAMNLKIAMGQIKVR